MLSKIDISAERLSNIQKTLNYHQCKLQVEDHFLVAAVQSSFGPEPLAESMQFRSHLLKLYKQAFLVDFKYTADTEKCLAMLQHLLSRTESRRVIANDAGIFFGSVILLLCNESNALKSKSLAILAIFLKQLDARPQEEESDDCVEMYSRSIESLIVNNWSRVEASKIFICLNFVAKQRPALIGKQLKELIASKVEESASKFRYNVELKNVLFTFFEYLDGDQGKMYLNERLGSLWY